MANPLAYEKPQRWQPMRTVPKDGTWILLHYNPHCAPLVTFWMKLHNDDRKNHWASHEQLGTNKPKYWMPMPLNPFRQEPII